MKRQKTWLTVYHFWTRAFRLSHSYSCFCFFSFLWVPKTSFPSSPSETQRSEKDGKWGKCTVVMSTAVTWSLGAGECQLSCPRGLGKKWLNAVILMESTDCLDHLHHHLQLTFSSLERFLSGLTMFSLQTGSLSILWREEAGEGLWLEIWLWVFFNKFSKNLKKRPLKKISVNYLLLL